MVLKMMEADKHHLESLERFLNETEK